MKILIIDQISNCLDMAIRAQAWGHEVRMYMGKNKDGDRSKVGTGLVQRVPAWEPHMNWADLIVSGDNVKYIHALEPYRKKGYPIIGPSVDASRWELRRDIGESAMQRAGIPIIPSQTFKNYDEAIKYVATTGKRYVSKPIGDIGKKGLSYVSKSAADMIFMLQQWKKSNAYKGEFILQEFVGGIEMAVGGWFGPGGFSKWWCENWEFKKLMNDDKGEATGEQGTILRYTQESKLAEKVLAPLEGQLHGLGYTGYVDVNCIIPEDGNPMPLEFTMRYGYPLIQIQDALHRGDPIQWQADMVNGYDTLRVSTNIACGVVISIPDYPYSQRPEKEYTGFPLFGLTEEDVLGEVHLSQVMWGSAPAMEDGKVKMDVPMYVTAGNYVCTVARTGETVKEASDRAYKTIDRKIDIPNSIMYRTDIGCRLEEQLPKLQKMGFAKGMKYG